jgi:hypothetical protein
VAKSATGKMVSRVGATGGGKAYKKSRPANYYGVLVVIIVLGLLSAVFARYDYQHPGKAKHAIAPAIGTTWYAGLSIQACGVTLPDLVPDPTSAGGFVIQSDNVIRISPTTAADAGSNATLSQFSDEFPGLISSSNELAVPLASGQANPKTTYKNGQDCPATSKYAGQPGKVVYAYWSSISQKKPVITTDSTTIKFKEYMRVTMAFEPTGVTPSAPSATTVDAMVKAGSAVTTTTTAPVTTTTVAGGSTTTTTTPTTTTTKG